MNSMVSVTITDNETGDVVIKDDYDDFRQFRILLFTVDGRTHILGKLPWKVMKNPYKQWVRTWAETHTGELKAMIRQYRPETTNGEIVSLMQDIENETVKVFGMENGKRDMAVASHMWRELLRAITITVRKVANDIKTIWEFPQPLLNNTDNTDRTSVIGWLFRRR